MSNWSFPAFLVPRPGCVVKLNFSLAIGLARGKSRGGLHSWLPVVFFCFCFQSMLFDKWPYGRVAKSLAFQALMLKGPGLNSSLAPLCFLPFCARRQGGRKGLIGQLVRPQGGRKGSIGQPAKHQGGTREAGVHGWLPVAQTTADPRVGSTVGCLEHRQASGFRVKLLGLRV